MAVTGACLICGEELEYLDTPIEMTCAMCGKTFPSNCRCQNGHFICDACHRESALSVIWNLVKDNTSKNPVEVLDLLMDQPETHMHGPEHHVLVPVALLVAYHNAGGKLDLTDAVKQAQMRGSQIPGGACGFWGSCGAASGAGIFLSIALKCTPVKREHYDDINRLTSLCLGRIADIGGPRCCKRNSYLSIIEASNYVAEHFDIHMELPSSIVCHHVKSNKECLYKDCPFFPTASR